jgi:hypothetical protein
MELKDDLFPKETVLDDITCTDGIVQEAATQYFYDNYANENQKKLLRRERRLNTFKVILIYGLIIVGLAWAGLNHYLG